MYNTYVSRNYVNIYIYRNFLLNLICNYVLQLGTSMHVNNCFRMKQRGLDFMQILN